MGDSLNRVTNACGQVIEVGHSYRVNDVAPENACRQHVPGIEVKVVELKKMGPFMMAKLDYPHGANEYYMSWIVVDRLYATQLVAGTFRPVGSYTNRIS